MLLRLRALEVIFVILALILFIVGYIYSYNRPYVLYPIIDIQKPIEINSRMLIINSIFDDIYLKIPMNTVSTGTFTNYQTDVKNSTDNIHVINNITYYNKITTNTQTINNVLSFSTSAQYMILYDTVYSTQSYKIQIINGILTATKL